MTDNGKVFKLSNSYLDENDHLYHIGLLQTDDLEKRFHDVKVTSKSNDIKTNFYCTDRI